MKKLVKNTSVKMSVKRTSFFLKIGIIKYKITAPVQSKSKKDSLSNSKCAGDSTKPTHKLRKNKNRIKKVKITAPPNIVQT